MRSRLPITLLSAGALLLAAPLFAAQISGDYLETRSADVYTGPCFANAEVGLTGNDEVHQLAGERVQPRVQDVCKHRCRHDDDGHRHEVPGTAGAEFPSVCCNAAHGSTRRL